jgi:hypothetical protein
MSRRMGVILSMNTNFFNFVGRVINLCCAKSNNSDKPVECQEAEDAGVEVLYIQEKVEEDK